MVLKPIRGPFGTFDEDLLGRVETVFAGENLLQVILHAHLLLERALHYKIAEKLVRPDVLTSNRFARLSFAQKVAMFVGLHDPKPDTEQLLLAFNRLRNTIVHEITDPDSAVKQHLAPVLEACMKADDSQLSPPEDPIAVVQLVFGSLALFHLGALHGVHRVDEEIPCQENTERNEPKATYHPVLSRRGKPRGSHRPLAG